MQIKNGSHCALIVAHPDDETLWAGGFILMNPLVKWTVITLCRKSDSDRAPKFFRTLNELNANGFMGDLDDGPGQTPLEDTDVEDEILNLLPARNYDIILTHGPKGEYTSHRRHEEAGRCVCSLLASGRLKAKRLCKFAYEDNNGAYTPKPDLNADLKLKLPNDIYSKKQTIICNIYGFSPESFEARVVSSLRSEAFIFQDIS